MFDTTESQTRLTKLAWGTALATLVIGQLHALARHRTEDGRSDLDLPATAFWAEPAGRALDPLLSWAGPDTVYLAYGKWWMLAIGVMVAAGVMVMRLRAPYGVERWGWRIMLVGYVLLALGAGAFYWGQWTSYNVLEDIGLWMDLPGALLGSIGGHGARHRPAAPEGPAEAGRGAPAPGHPGAVRDHRGHLARQRRPADHVRHRDARQRRDPEGRDRARRAVDPGGPGDTMSG